MVELCHSREQNNDYNNYSHNPIASGVLFCFVSVCEKEIKGGNTWLNFPFSTYLTILLPNQAWFSWYTLCQPLQQ
jgi:hypothetical protein